MGGLAWDHYGAVRSRTTGFSEQGILEKEVLDRGPPECGGSRAGGCGLQGATEPFPSLLCRPNSSAGGRGRILLEQSPQQRMEPSANPALGKNIQVEAPAASTLLQKPRDQTLPSHTGPPLLPLEGSQIRGFYCLPGPGGASHSPASIPRSGETLKPSGLSHQDPSPHALVE